MRVKELRWSLQAIGNIVTAIDNSSDDAYEMLAFTKSLLGDN